MSKGLGSITVSLNGKPIMETISTINCQGRLYRDIDGRMMLFVGKLFKRYGTFPSNYYRIRGGWS